MASDATRMLEGDEASMKGSSWESCGLNLDDGGVALAAPQ